MATGLSWETQFSDFSSKRKFEIAVLTGYPGRNENAAGLWGLAAKILQDVNYLYVFLQPMC